MKSQTKAKRYPERTEQTKVYRETQTETEGEDEKVRTTRIFSDTDFLIIACFTTNP